MDTLGIKVKSYAMKWTTQRRKDGDEGEETKPSKQTNKQTIQTTTYTNSFND